MPDRQLHALEYALTSVKRQEGALRSAVNDSIERGRHSLPLDFLFEQQLSGVEALGEMTRSGAMSPSAIVPLTPSMVVRAGHLILGKVAPLSRSHFM